MRKKKPFYVSLNRLELDLLAIASHEEVALYVTILKRLANFKTGLVGTFQKEALTYEDLAVKLSRPSSQGKPANLITRDRVRDLVLKLESRGLVSDVQILGKTLILLLPLSPIDYDGEDVPTSKPNQQADSETKKVQTNGNKKSQEPDDTWLYDVFASDVSVLTNTHQSHTTNSTPQIISSDERASSFDNIEGEQQEDSDPWSESSTNNIGNHVADSNTEGGIPPSIAQLGDIHPLLEMNAHLNAPPLSADIIGKFLRDRGIMYAGTATSKGLYLRWLRTGVTCGQLDEAVEVVNSDMTMMQTPHSIDTALMRQRSSQRKRGGLVL